MSTYTLVIEKWQVRPEPKWIPNDEKQVEVHETPKRIKITSGSFYRGKVFDKQTGREIKARGGSSWFRYSIRIPVAEAVSA